MTTIKKYEKFEKARKEILIIWELEGLRSRFKMEKRKKIYIKKIFPQVKMHENLLQKKSKHKHACMISLVSIRTGN